MSDHPDAPLGEPMKVKWTRDEILLAATSLAEAGRDADGDVAEWLRPGFLSEEVAPMLRAFAELAAALSALVKDGQVARHVERRPETLAVHAHELHQLVTEMAPHMHAPDVQSAVYHARISSLLAAALPSVDEDTNG